MMSQSFQSVIMKLYNNKDHQIFAVGRNKLLFVFVLKYVMILLCFLDDL